MSEVDDLLESARSGALKLQAVVVVDWRDGPIEGLALLSAGKGLWKFQLFAELPSSEDLSERLFLFSALTERSAERQLLQVAADSRLPLIWPFGERPDAVAVVSAVDAALETAERPTLVVSSRDFDVVTKVWLIEEASFRRPPEHSG
ncbi:hypothetical protein [Micromonospora sp. NPDC005197]|uniref:hypothetical protein n=1 Tax=unclassified Micromonospora TaxID=2617518 RepID=UPI0033B73F61